MAGGTEGGGTAAAGERTATQRTLRGRTVFITGGSRGIGLEIAKRAARDGANVTIAAKTSEPHPKLPGTIHTAAEEIEAAGGNALPVQCDIRNEEEVTAAIQATMDRFGGLDVLVNNASAIYLKGTADVPMKRFDLMHEVNARGTFLCSQAALPALRESSNPHILTLAPPLNLDPRWFGAHLAYTMSKYGMSMCVLGMAEELREQGIGVNALWPRTIIHTAALNLLPGIDVSRCRKPEIMADAAHAILTRPARETTGNFFIDDEVLAAEGIEDLEQYAVEPGLPLLPDLFL